MRAGRALAAVSCSRSSTASESHRRRSIVCSEDFATARLVTFDNDPVTRMPTVEIAHEALLVRWRRLREWVDEYRESLIMYRRYRTALAEWEQAGRDPDYLLRQGRLRQFESWQLRTDLALTDTEAEYLRASREREDEAASARRRRRRLAAAALGLLAMVAMVFGVVALVQRSRAEDQQRLAEEQADLAVEEAARAEEQERDRDRPKPRERRGGESADRSRTVCAAGHRGGGDDAARRRERAARGGGSAPCSSIRRSSRLDGDGRTVESVGCVRPGRSPLLRGRQDLRPGRGYAAGLGLARIHG